MEFRSSSATWDCFTESLIRKPSESIFVISSNSSRAISSALSISAPGKRPIVRIPSEMEEVFTRILFFVNFETRASSTISISCSTPSFVSTPRRRKIPPSRSSPRLIPLLENTFPHHEGSLSPIKVGVSSITDRKEKRTITVTQRRDTPCINQPPPWICRQRPQNRSSPRSRSGSFLC